MGICNCKVPSHRIQGLAVLEPQAPSVHQKGPKRQEGEGVAPSQTQGRRVDPRGGVQQLCRMQHMFQQMQVHTCKRNVATGCVVA